MNCRAGQFSPAGKPLMPQICRCSPWPRGPHDARPGLSAELSAPARLDETGLFLSSLTLIELISYHPPPPLPNQCRCAVVE